MIDLSRNRAALLAEIEAPERLGDPLIDITDPRVATMDARVRICGHEQKLLFSLLKNALLERFAKVPRSQLLRDLLIPLKNALGNAYKHGNGKDSDKAILVELVLSTKGALIAVRDEGRGFDVAHTFRRYRDGENYFANHGIGFRNLHRAVSTVSFENGGRTLLLCFRPSISVGWRRGARTWSPPVLDNTGESCRVYPPDDCGARYVVRLVGQPAEIQILTGRLHATEAAAEADFEAARTLHEAKALKRLRIPRPVARPATEPRLVLYDFDPWMNLWEYHAYRRSPKSLRHSAERVGRALAGLHCSRVLRRGGVPDELPARVTGAETYLLTLPDGIDLVNRFRVAAARIIRPRNPASIHGALNWDCVYYGVDGRFYLYRFETSRRSDPGLDLGGFAADLLRFTLASHDGDAYRMCCDAFLSHYNAKAESAMGVEDLRFYTTLALAERLRQANHDTSADAAQLLQALDAALAD